MELSSQDRQRISAAIHAAEEKTSGEIVCVLARSSTDSTALPLVIALTAAAVHALPAGLLDQAQVGHHRAAAAFDGPCPQSISSATASAASI